MSTDTAAETHAAHEVHAHPSDWQYVKIALFLGVLTAVEIAISYIEALEGAKAVALLLGLAAVKFATVALYFMHLKFDSPFMRSVFIAGLLFALAIYPAYLMTLGVFSKEWPYVVGFAGVMMVLGALKLIYGMRRRSST